MCTSPFYRFPVTNLKNKQHAKMNLGWSAKSSAFIFSKKRVDVLEYLFVTYPDRVDFLQEIPCGQCMECRINSSKQLAQRALAESTMHNENYFITLTYDDEHLPLAYTVSRKTGDPGLYSVLVRKHYDDFVKKLRRYFEYYFGITGIMLFPCGEYGSESGRAHFHFIAFGLPLSLITDPTKKLQYFKDISLSGRHYEYLICPLIEDLWDKGFVTIGEVNWETCAYVARYVTKKMIGKSEKEYLSYCEQLNVPPQPREFHGAPKRPGMGLRYYEEHKDDIYRIDKVVLPGGKVSQPCYYYDKKYDVDNPELMALTKEQRREKAQKSKMLKFKGFTPQQVEIAEKTHADVFENRIKRLKRSL